MASSLAKSLNRRFYVWTIVGLFVIQIVGAIASVYVPSLDRLPNTLSTVVIALAALATGSRLVDAGYRRWIGIVGVIVIGWLLPFVGVILWLALTSAARTDNPPSEIFYISGASTLLLVVFFIWAGTRPSATATPG